MLAGLILTLIRTVICGSQSVRFARTVILAYGPSFAGGPTVEHSPYVIHEVSHPCLWTVIYD